MALPEPDIVSSYPSEGTPAIDKEKLPFIARLFGVLSIVIGFYNAVTLGFFSAVLILASARGDLSSISSLNQQTSTAAIVIYIVEISCLGILAALFVVLGVRLLRNKRKFAAQMTDVMIAFVVSAGVCEIMLGGLSLGLIPYAVGAVFLVAMQSYLDPMLAGERELQRKLRDMEVRDQAEDGTLGLDPTGKGYLTLNFFNLFWIFVVCCIFGLVLETIYHIAVVDPGHYENRAGMLFGPFSPIYGFGAVLMTIALNRFHKAPLIVVFLVSAVIGGAFEYAVSWFMQFAFGIIAWDYTGTFLSIDGRTNGMFMCMWGVLGMVWIKCCLPWLLKLVNRIPWNWRYSFTSVCAVLMIADGAMTLMSLDRWYQREAGFTSTDTAVAAFFDEHFDNSFMENRFQSMSIDPSDAARTH